MSGVIWIILPFNVKSLKVIGGLVPFGLGMGLEGLGTGLDKLKFSSSSPPLTLKNYSQGMQPLKQPWNFKQ